jgi:hypothetical protein
MRRLPGALQIESRRRRVEQQIGKLASYFASLDLAHTMPIILNGQKIRLWPELAVMVLMLATPFLLNRLREVAEHISDGLDARRAARER